MNRTAIVTLKALIVVMIVLVLACQIFIVPEAAEQSAYYNPEFAYLKVPGILITVAFLLCVQLALVCVWQLLTLAGASVIFSKDAFKWVNGILYLVIAATLLIFGSFIILQAAGVASGSVNLMCVFGVVLGAGFALLVVVLRGLLHQASQLEQDLSEVV
ncbi:DUF2975 domain-containing protein [Homoserinimonas sp. A447]